MNLEGLLDHLEGILTEDIAAKARVAALVARQEKAILSNSSIDLDLATRGIESEVVREVERAGRRERIFEHLAARWNVAPGALTLASIAERSGARAERLRTLRADLRASIAEIVRRNRRVARLVQVNRRLVQDTIAVLAGLGEDEPVRAPGLILDAKG